jgi:hypothetical protein
VVAPSTLLYWVAALGVAQLAPAVLAEDIVMASLPVGECILSVETRTQEPHLLRVRTFHPRHSACQADQASLSRVLEQALANRTMQQPPTRYSSMSLGRLVDHPWLSALLARAAASDPGWNTRSGRPVRDGLNHYVAGLLARPAVIDQLQPALAAGGYRITGASVEKVLVASARAIPGLGDDRLTGRLPFDAMLWFHLQAR